MDESGRRLADLRRRIEPTVRMAQAGLPGRILGRLVEVRFLDRTVILAAQAFSAILPLLIVVSTISPQPGGDSPAAFMARRLGLAADDVSSLQVAVAPPPSARASIVSSVRSSPCSPRPASPGPCSAATSWPGGCRGPGCGPPGVRSPW
jgi:hypothetical protein